MNVESIQNLTVIVESDTPQWLEWLKVRRSSNKEVLAIVTKNKDVINQRDAFNASKWQGRKRKLRAKKYEAECDYTNTAVVRHWS